jgi:hypothetical protein
MQINSAGFAEKVLYGLLLVSLVVQFFFLSILSNYQEQNAFSWERNQKWKLLGFLRGSNPENNPRNGLSCSRYGGPSDQYAEEMIYWREIPSDWDYVSPFQSHGPHPKYLVFELDIGRLQLIFITASVPSFIGSSS